MFFAPSALGRTITYSFHDLAAYPYQILVGIANARASIAETRSLISAQALVINIVTVVHRPSSSCHWTPHTSALENLISYRFTTKGYIAQKADWVILKLWRTGTVIVPVCCDFYHLADPQIRCKSLL